MNLQAAPHARLLLMLLLLTAPLGCSDSNNDAPPPERGIDAASVSRLDAAHALDFGIDVIDSQYHDVASDAAEMDASIEDVEHMPNHDMIFADISNIDVGSDDDLDQSDRNVDMSIIDAHIFDAIASDLDPLDVIAPIDINIEDQGALTDGLAPGEHEVIARVVDSQDALSSYLMDPEAGAWNIFAGETVYFGRRAAAPYVSYHTALRFQGVQIPARAEVLEATLRVTPHNAVDSSNALALNVYAERVADSAPFESANYDSGRPDQRLRTAAFIDGWVVRCADPCREEIEWDCEQRVADCWDPAVVYASPKDLAPLVQEVIELEGWQAGNALTVFVVNRAGDQDTHRYNDSRALIGFDEGSPERAPTLTIRYRLAP